MRGSDFILDSVQLLHYKCHKINFKRGSSYIDWIKKKNATTNPKNTDDKCIQYAVTVASNYEEIKWNPERVLNIKTFIKKYDWKGINYPTKTDDQKKKVKKLPALLHRIASKHKVDFYCLNCLHSFRTENKLSLMKKYAKIKTSAEL